MAPAAGGADGIWIFSDPGTENFNHEVDLAILADAARCLSREAAGIVHADIGGTRTWTAMEHVQPRDRDDWLECKRTGAGRDPRLLPTHKEARLFRDGVRDLKKVIPLPKTFRGPSAEQEIAGAVLASGVEPPAYHQQWVVRSGVGAKSAAAREHLLLLYALWLLVCIDGADIVNLSSAEHLARRIMMLERAVRRNPRAPDFEGLDAYMEHMVEGGRGLPLADFEKHISEVQKADAQIMKQARLAREESEADAKRRSGGGQPNKKKGGKAGERAGDGDG